MGAAVAGIVWLGALSAYDIRQRRLPNWLTLPGAAVIFVVAALSERGGAALAGAAALAALYAVMHLASPRSLGGGDVKLALGVGAMTGAFGPDVWLLAAIGAPLLTSMLALVAAMRGVTTVPHGPSMCLASAAAVALVVV
ncbi:prepilin peptidase [Mycolicibacterium sp. XJ870]